MDQQLLSSSTCNTTQVSPQEDAALSDVAILSENQQQRKAYQDTHWALDVRSCASTCLASQLEEHFRGGLAGVVGVGRRPLPLSYQHITMSPTVQHA
jgi:hypothetical protein